MFEEIAPRVFVDVGYAGANVTAVRTEAGVVAIDTPWLPREASAWARAVRALGEARYLIFTEPHDDHTVGACWLGAPTVIAHDLTAESLRMALADRDAWLADYRAEAGVFADEGEFDGLDRWHPVFPDVTFDHRLTLSVGGATLALHHLPGHTRGQTAVHLLDARVLVTGDNLFNRLPAWVPSRVPLGTWLESLDRIEAFDVDRYVPGHGEVGGREIVAFTRDYLTRLRDVVTAAVARGWSREETVERTPMPDGLSVGRGWQMIYRDAVGNVYDQMRAG